MRAPHLLLVLGSVWLVAGCVSGQAGFRETRAIVHARLAADLPNDDGATDAAVAEWLESPLDANRCVRIALLRSPRVRAAYDGVGVARGALVEAIRLPNPSLDASLRFRGKDSDPDVDLGASVELRELALLPFRESAAADGLDEASIRAADAILDVALDVRLAYVDWLAARQTLELEKSILTAAAASAELARAIHDAGNESELRSLMEQSLYEQARLDYAEADARTVDARDRLDLAMGLSAEEGARWTSADRLADPPDDEISIAKLEPNAVANNLALGALRAKYASAAGRVNEGIATGAIPSVRVGVLAERDPEGWGVGPSISVGVPLFYQEEGAIDAAHADMKATQDEAIALAGDIRSRARSLAVGLAGARDRALHYKTVVLPLDARIVQAAELEFNAQTISPFQLLQTKRDEIQAVGSSRVDLQACKLEYSIVSPK